MNRQTVKRLMVKGIMTYIAVFSVVLMVAIPALAVLADSVGTNEIRDHSIRSADIRNKAVTTDRIAPRAVKRGKIGKRAIRTEHVKYISDSKIRYSTKRLALPAAAFTPTGPAASFYNGGGAAGFAAFVAPVSLPDGAKIIKIRIAYYDFNPSVDIKVALMRYNFSTFKDTGMSNWLSSSGSESAWRYLHDNTINDPIINNSRNNYYVFASSNAGSLAIGQALITYSLAGP